MPEMARLVYADGIQVVGADKFACACAAHPPTNCVNNSPVRRTERLKQAMPASRQTRCRREEPRAPGQHGTHTNAVQRNQSRSEDLVRDKTDPARGEE